MSDLFARATRGRWRFDSSVGALTVEQLWDLPLRSARTGSSLDEVGKSLLASKAAASVGSLIDDVSPTTDLLDAKIEIVKMIIQTKQAEAQAAETARANSARRAQILEVLARKQNSALEERSTEDLLAELNSLS